MKITTEVIEQFIREEIAEPTADRTVYRSWYKYAKETGKFNITYGHAPGFCRLARLAGMSINEECGFDVIKIMFPGIWRHNEIVQFRDCLLYTSPSPRDATLSRMPSSA